MTNMAWWVHRDIAGMLLIKNPLFKKEFEQKKKKCQESDSNRRLLWSPVSVAVVY